MFFGYTASVVCPFLIHPNNVIGKGGVDVSDFREILVDPRENVLAVLGNSYAQNYLNTGNISNGFVILSNERVYFKGSCMYKVNGKYHSSDEERVLDLKDVTGTGFETINPIHLLWTAIGIWVLTFFYWISPLSVKNSHSIDVIFCVGLIVGAVFGFRYITRKSTIFRIDYAGGNVMKNIQNIKIYSNFY